MNWTTINFGKHTGKTLPHVLLHDPDWFYWATDKHAFQKRTTLELEASTLLHKSTHITLPAIAGNPQHAEHFIDRRTGKYSHFVLVPADKPRHAGASETIRQSILDLSLPRAYAPFDKLGCRNLLACFRTYYFGKASARITSSRAEAFFDADEQFLERAATGVLQCA